MSRLQQFNMGFGWFSRRHLRDRYFAAQQRAIWAALRSINPFPPYIIPVSFRPVPQDACDGFRCGMQECRVSSRTESYFEIGVAAFVAFHSWPSAALAGKISDLITTGTAPELSSISPMSMKSNCLSSSPSMEMTGFSSFISSRK